MGVRTGASFVNSVSKLETSVADRIVGMKGALIRW